MNIVYTFDDDYSEITAVSMLSLLENNKDEKEINLFIIDCGIKEHNKTRIETLAKRFNRTIKFIEAKNMENKIPIKLDVSFWSFVCYVRLFFAELLPDIDKIMHIDCDTIVRGKLGDIYNIKLGENLCAACYDCIPSPKFTAGFVKESGYFSNGILIFDLKSMREENIQEKFVQYIVTKKGDLPHLDQDVVNAVMANRILALPAEYNLMTYTALFKEKMCKVFEPIEPYYSVQEIKKAIENPIMVHFVGYRFVSRPWLQPCYHPYNEEWINYYQRIAFDDKQNILDKKTKKYGAIREIVCILWNYGYKLRFIRNVEFLMEKKRIKKLRLKYEIKKNNEAG